MNFHSLFNKKYKPNTPMMINPSERIKGRNEINKQEVIGLFISIVKTPRLINNAKRGSVNPEKVSAKYNGEKINIRAPIIALLMFNFRAILNVKKIVNNATIALNILTPIKSQPTLLKSTSKGK